MSGSEEEEYVDALGVITALERTCELEAKLRQAIQDTHPLTTTLDWDFNAADREREALLAISEQLEYLEDKLREYRFLEPAELENKAVLLGQLDAVRRELVEVVDRFMPHVLFGKEAVREVLAFAQVAEDSGEEGELVEGEEEGLTVDRGLTRGRSGNGSGSMSGFASEIEHEEQDELGPGGMPGHARRDTYGAEPDSGLIPAARRSTGAPQRPPRYPTQQQGMGPGGGVPKEQAHAYAYGRQNGAPVPSPKRPSAQQLGASTSPTSLHQQHEQQRAYMQQQQSPSRSAFLQHQQRPGSDGGSHGHPLGANVVPGAASGSSSPGAVATASALRSATATATAAGRQGRRQLDVDVAARAAGTSVNRSSDNYSFSHPHPQPAVSVPSFPAEPPSSYAPSSYAPSDGTHSSRQSPQPLARTAAVAAPALASCPSSAPNAGHVFLLSKLNRAQGNSGTASGRYTDSAASSRYGVYNRVSDEDIYGALDERSGGCPASITNPSPCQYGGFIKMRDRLSQAEKAGVEQVPGPRSPMPPRIYGEVMRMSDGWEAGSEIKPASHSTTLSLDPPTLPKPGRYQEQHPARTASVWSASPSHERLHLAYSSGGAGVVGRTAHSATRGAESSRGGRADGGSEGSGGVVRGLLSQLTNLLLTGAAVTVAVVLAQQAGPVVAQKGREVASEVARKAQKQHQRLSVRRQASQQRKREEQAQVAATAALPWQQGGRMADLPQRGAGNRMTDLPHCLPAGKMADLPQRPSTGTGRMADLPPHRKPTGVPDMPRQQPQQQQPKGQRQEGGAVDPLPPFLAAAVEGATGRRCATGGTPGFRSYDSQHGQLFPAMPPPDVSASMG